MHHCVTCATKFEFALCNLNSLHSLWLIQKSFSIHTHADKKKSSEFYSSQLKWKMTMRRHMIMESAIVLFCFFPSFCFLCTVQCSMFEVQLFISAVRSCAVHTLQIDRAAHFLIGVIHTWKHFHVVSDISFRSAAAKINLFRCGESKTDVSSFLLVNEKLNHK